MLQGTPHSIGPGHERLSTLGCLGLPSRDDVLSDFQGSMLSINGINTHMNGFDKAVEFRDDSTVL